jgi:RHS repeat-associated protein
MDSAGGYMKVIYDYNANNELQSANGDVFEFDLNGNMLSKYVPGAGEIGYVWNSADKLIGVDFPDGSFTRFFYRHDGLRYRRVDSDGSETLYFWGAGGVPPLLAERRGSGAVMPGAGGVKNSPQNGEIPAWLSYPPGLNAVITSSGEITYRLTDHLGSITAITDEKGNITTQYDYDEFGIPVPPPSSGTGSSGAAGIFNIAGTGFAGNSSKTSPASTAGYTGEPQQTEPAGLVYLRQRYYDPEMGRFITRDPIYVNNVFGLSIKLKSAILCFYYRLYHGKL